MITSKHWRTICVFAWEPDYVMDRSKQKRSSHVKNIYVFKMDGCHNIYMMIVIIYDILTHVFTYILYTYIYTNIIYYMMLMIRCKLKGSI